MAVLSLAVFLSLLLAPLVATQVQTVQDDWVFPQLPDHSTTLEPDQSYTLKWTSNLQNWFPYFCKQCNATRVDLWVVAVDVDTLHKIASDVDVTSTLSLEWTATVPALELENAKIWSFQFVPKDVVPAQGAEQISSPQFNLGKTSGVLSTSSTSSPSSSSTSTTIPASMTTSTSTTPSNTGSGTTTSMPSPTNTSESLRNATSGLSPGGKAGIGVGVSVGGLVLFALGWFLARHYKRSPMTTMPPQQDMISPHNYALPDNSTFPQRFPSSQGTASLQHTVCEPPRQGSTEPIYEAHGTPFEPHPPFQPPPPFPRDST
ncbi:hypothetical protein F4680DRAFT_368787 [Xylaria scruposa]|nr:hypothetical protein F4680DRAFT_368787 [Xylaria scruposa]